MILDLFKLDGKVAIVTGAGRGIGQAYALGLAEAGADVAVVDVIDMEETVAAIKALGRKAIAVKADLSKGEKEAPKIVAKVVKSLKLDKYELDVEVDKNGYIVGDISTDGVKSAKELVIDDYKEDDPE
jgi:NAD(P)-dependent dehydrogenase (short-subunit alcohol dehydrogenase family)